MSQGTARLGLLGTGAISQVVHLPILSQMPNASVEVVCDQDHAKASAIANRFGVPFVVHRDEEVFEADLDGVILCTPSYLHESQAIAALEAGKHVLVEKPLALTAEGAERVLQTAERTGRSVVVAMNNRRRPDVRALKPFLQGRELGDVFFVKAGWLNRRGRTPRPTWRQRRATAGGGALMDLGIQMLDLSMWLLDFPPIDRVLAHVHKSTSLEVEDAAAVVMSARGGPVLSLEVTWSLAAPRDRHYLHVLGSQGSGSLPPLSVHKEIEHGLLDVTPQVITGRENLYTSSYRSELADFVDVCLGGPAPPPPREQIQIMQLMALAYRSAEEGREIVL